MIFVILAIIALIGYSINGFLGAFIGLSLGNYLYSFYLKQELDELKNKNLSYALYLKERVEELSTRLSIERPHEPPQAICAFPEASVSSAENAKKPVKSAAAAHKPAESRISQPAKKAASQRAAVKKEVVTEIAASFVPDLLMSLLDTPLGRYIRKWFHGSNSIVSIGVVILFIGVGFLVSLAEWHIPVEFYLSAVALSGAGLVFGGWRLKDGRRRIYGLYLQGAGIGVLFITVFAAFHLYHLLGSVFAFSLMSVLGLLGISLALVNNAIPLAVLAITGAFLAPLLTSSGQGNHITLLSYYLLINLLILAVSWFKTWPVLNRLGFAFTFVISVGWGVLDYQPDYFASVESFLLTFFLIYVTIPLLAARKEAFSLRGSAQIISVFDVPMAFFGIQAALLYYFPDIIRVSDSLHLSWLAITALALGVFYGALWKITAMQDGRAYTMLRKGFLANCIIFSTLAVPLALGAEWTALIWAVEGAAFVWLGWQQNNWVSRLLGLKLQIFAGAALLTTTDNHGMFLFNGIYISSCVLAAASLFSAYLYHTHDKKLTKIENNLHLLSLLPFLAMGCWFVAGLVEIFRHSNPYYSIGGSLLFIACSAVFLENLGISKQWKQVRIPLAWMLPVMVAVSIVKFSLGLNFWNYAQEHTLYILFSLVAGLAAISAHYYYLWNRRDQSLASHHLGALWLIIIAVSWKAHGALMHMGSSAHYLPFFLIPAIAIYGISRATQDTCWLFKNHYTMYMQKGIFPVVALLLGWVLISHLLLDGGPNYLPVLSALDIGQFIALYAIWFYAAQPESQKVIAAKIRHADRELLCYGLLFIQINFMIIRTVHHMRGIPFEVNLLFHSAFLQTIFSILWAATSLSLMLLASHKNLRRLWVIAASLLAVTVIKLFLIDLGNTGGVARTVSFIGVGVLIMGFGYFSPLPSAHKEVVN